MTATADTPAAEAVELVTLTIDGTEVSVPKGTLIIRAAEQVGIEIPRFCDHPALKPAGTSWRRRNGVGVSGDGRQVFFVISDAPVNFHTFARLFRDRLEVPNALYLDGAVSKVDAPALERNESGLDMGPIVGVVRATGKS